MKTALSVDRDPTDVYGGLYVPNIINEDVSKYIKPLSDGGISIGIWELDYIKQISRSEEEFDMYRTRLWTGIDDPYVPISCIASIVRPNPIPSDIPFSTSFCAGIGTGLFVHGTRVKNECWGNMSAMDIQTTYNLPQLKEFDCCYDYFNAFEGGRSLKFTIIDDGLQPLIHLFQTRFSLDQALTISMICSVTGSIAPSLSYLTGPTFITLVPTKCICDTGWTTITYQIPADPGNIIKFISMTSDNGNKGDTLNVAQISVKKQNANKLTPVTELKFTDTKMDVGLLL